MSANTKQLAEIVRSIQNALFRHENGHISDLELIKKAGNAAKQVEQLKDITPEDADSWNDESSRP